MTDSLRSGHSGAREHTFVCPTSACDGATSAASPRGLSALARAGDPRAERAPRELPCRSPPARSVSPQPRARCSRRRPQLQREAHRVHRGTRLEGDEGFGNVLQPAERFPRQLRELQVAHAATQHFAVARGHVDWGEEWGRVPGGEADPELGFRRPRRAGYLGKSRCVSSAFTWREMAVAPLGPARTRVWLPSEKPASHASA